MRILHELMMYDVARIDGGSPTLVFLHEGLGSRSAWRDFPAALAEATGLAALISSRRGYGRAPPRDQWPVGFMHEEARELALADDVVLVGHSDGASIALLYAAEHPVRALVLEAPHVFVEDKTVAAIAELPKQTALVDRLARHHADARATFGGWTGIWLSPEFRSWNIEACLPRVKAPTLVIQGADDEYGTLAQVDAIAARIGGRCETLVLPHCGHSPHRDRREVTLAAMARFVRAVL